MVPALGRSRPTIRRPTEVLPLPLSPTMPRISPSRTLKVADFTASKRERRKPEKAARRVIAEPHIARNRPRSRVACAALPACAIVAPPAMSALPQASAQRTQWPAPTCARRQPRIGASSGPSPDSAARSGSRRDRQSSQAPACDRTRPAARGAARSVPASPQAGSWYRDATAPSAPPRQDRTRPCRRHTSRRHSCRHGRRAADHA